MEIILNHDLEDFDEIINTAVITGEDVLGKEQEVRNLLGVFLKNAYRVDLSMLVMFLSAKTGKEFDTYTKLTETLLEELGDKFIPFLESFRTQIETYDQIVAENEEAKLRKQVESGEVETDIDEE